MQPVPGVAQLVGGDPAPVGHLVVPDRHRKPDEPAPDETGRVAGAHHAVVVAVAALHRPDRGDLAQDRVPRAVGVVRLKRVGGGRGVDRVHLGSVARERIDPLGEIEVLVAVPRGDITLELVRALEHRDEGNGERWRRPHRQGTRRSRGGEAVVRLVRLGDRIGRVHVGQERETRPDERARDRHVPRCGERALLPAGRDRAARGRDREGLHQSVTLVQPHPHHRRRGVALIGSHEHPEEPVAARDERHVADEGLDALGDVEARDPHIDRGTGRRGIGDRHRRGGSRRDGDGVILGTRRVGGGAAGDARGAHRVLPGSEVGERPGGRQLLAVTVRPRHRHRGVHPGRQPGDRDREASGGRRALHGEGQGRRLRRGDRHAARVLPLNGAVAGDAAEGDRVRSRSQALDGAGRVHSDGDRGAAVQADGVAGGVGRGARGRGRDLERAGGGGRFGADDRDRFGRRLPGDDGHRAGVVSLYPAVGRDTGEADPVGARGEIGQRRRRPGADRLHLDGVEGQRVAVGVRLLAGRAGRDFDRAGGRGGELGPASARQPEGGGRTQEERAPGMTGPAAMSHRWILAPPGERRRGVREETSRGERRPVARLVEGRAEYPGRAGTVKRGIAGPLRTRATSSRRRAESSVRPAAARATGR